VNHPVSREDSRYLPTASGGPPAPPPKPPKLTARDLLEPGEPGRRIRLADYVVKDLAELLGLKSFKVVSDVLVLGQFKHADEVIDFSTAASSLTSMDMWQNASSTLVQPNHKCLRNCLS
jgi:hypothetical protein